MAEERLELPQSTLVWLSHDPLPTTALGVLHHQHGREGSPSIQPFIAVECNLYAHKLHILCLHGNGNLGTP